MAANADRLRPSRGRRPADFDEQLWPINSALVILAAVAGGIVYATSDFAEPRLLYNGWVRLASVGVLVLLLFFGMLWLQGKILRRLQLCILLSLLFHVGLAVYLYQQHLALMAQREKAVQTLWAPTEDIAPLPDYLPSQIEEPQNEQPYEKPIENEPPKPMEPEAVAREASPLEIPTDASPPDEPEIPQRQQPNPSIARRAELSAPRRAEAAAGGQISRQQWRHFPRPDEPIPAPEIGPEPQHVDALPGADLAAREPAAGSIEIQQRQVFEEPSSDPVAQADYELARHASDPQPPADLPTTPRPTRQADRPADMPRTEPAAPETVAAGSPAEASLPTPTAAQPAEPSDASPLRIAQQAVDPPGMALPAMTRAEQLPAAVAPRQSIAAQEEPRIDDDRPAQPSSLARADEGISLPSTVIPLENVPASMAAAMGGTLPSRLEAGASAALRRAAAPAAGESAAAPGVVEFALGSSQVVARSGQPRGAGMGQPSSTPSAPIARIARAPGPLDSIASSGVPESIPGAPGAVASDLSGATTPALGIQASAARQGGTVRQFAPNETIGAGPAGSSGTPGAVPLAQASRVSRQELVASALAGGGTSKPGRTSGGAVSFSSTAEAAQSAAAVPTAGEATQAPPLQALVSGPRRQASGLPGRLQSQAMAGAIAALTSEGAPLSAAAARRGEGTRLDAGGRDIGATASTTMKRAKVGVDLPAAAVPLENPDAGAGGVATTQGGLTSSLPLGSAASIRRASADVRIGAASAAAGPTDSVGGLAEAVALAGRIRGMGDDVPALAASRAVSGLRRSGSPGRAPTEGNAIAPSVAAAGATARAPGQTGATTSSDSAEGAAAQARLTGPRQDAGGMSGKLADNRAVDGAVELGPVATTPGTLAGPRRLPQGDQAEPPIAAQVGRGPLRRSDTPGLPRGIAEKIDQQPAASAMASEAGDAMKVAQGNGIGQPSRREGGLPVQIAAMPGPGGLGLDRLPEVGLPSRRARPESDIVHTIARRFLIERSGGELAIDGRIREQPSDAFRQRDVGQRAKIAQVHGGSEGTEKAVEMGLDFFARHQFPDGHWSLHQLPPGLKYADPSLGQMQADTAATGFALLTFLGAGYTHLEDKHEAVVRRGLDWLIRNQQPNGELSTGGARYTRFYSHGIAAISLCEAYGMTQDPELREPARRAVEFIIKSQHPSRGGWRYDVRPDTGQSTETDTSVSGWQLMALKSAQMAGLEVPAASLKKLNDWLDTAQAPGVPGQYVYNPYAPDTPEKRDGRRPNLAMTAEAMLMRMYLGRQRSDEGLIAGARFLNSNPPTVGNETKPLRDCYYWYYATQVMFQMQGAYWPAWNQRLQTLLSDSQVQTGEPAGSWHPLRPVPDRWGREGGRIYVTAMHLLMLEVYYRHLPLFQELIK